MSARDSEIVWHMLKPFDVKTIITPNGITQSIDGATPTAVNTGTGAMAASIARSMAAIMRGDWAELRAMFAVTLPDANPKGDWTVQLMPLDQRLQALLGKIAVQGCSDVSRVDVERPDGDREHIQFTTLP